MSERGTRLRAVADLLTWSRVGLGVLFLFLGIFVKEISLQLLVWLVCLGWLTDAVDGALARSSGMEGLSWVGQKDQIVDAFFAACLATSLLFSGYLSFFYWFIFAFIEFFAFLLRSHMLNMTFISAVYLAFIIISLSRSFTLGAILVGYALAAMIADWKRFKELVHIYLVGAGEIMRGKHNSPRRTA